MRTAKIVPADIRNQVGSILDLVLTFYEGMSPDEYEKIQRAILGLQQLTWSEGFRTGKDEAEYQYKNLVEACRNNCDQKTLDNLATVTQDRALLVDEYED